MSAVIVEAENPESDKVERSKVLSIELNGDTVYLNCRQLVVLPNRLFDEEVLNSLCRLYLQHNILESLPPEIKSFQHLHELCLKSNRLKVLPEEIGDLPNLEKLGVSDNQLTCIPRSVCHLRHLRCLRLARNKLTQLPAELGELQHLQTLEVSHNQLRRLPPELGRCHSLQQLCVDSNRMVTLPRQLCHLPQLTEISACRNQLVSLPQDVGRMAALQAVYVDDNAFLTAMPASTLNKTIGFCRSGQVAVPEHLMSAQQHILLSGAQEENLAVPLPPEIRSVGHMCTNGVPLLLELSLRVLYKFVQTSAMAIQDGELPSDLLSLLHTPTAHCQQCGTEIFVSAFPAVFRAQVEASNLPLLGLCCSWACMRQCSLVVHLPLLYPRLEHLALALVLA